MSSQPEARSPAEHVPKLAAVLGHADFPSGDRAKLKRMGLDGPAPLAFHRFVLRHIDEAWQGERWSLAWRAQIAALALQPAPSFNPGIPLGCALSKSGYAEARLERLLAATDATLLALALRAARFLAAKRQSADWRHLTELLFSSTDAARERIRTRIARDYYRTAARAETSTPAKD